MQKYVLHTNNNSPGENMIPSVDEQTTTTNDDDQGVQLSFVDIFYEKSVGSGDEVKVLQSCLKSGSRSGSASISTVDEIEITVGRSSEEESGIFYAPEEVLPKESKVQRKMFYSIITLVAIILALVVLLVMLILLIIPLFLVTPSPVLLTASPTSFIDSKFSSHPPTFTPTSLVRPTKKPTTSAASNSVIRSYLRTSGNQIMDNSGDTVRMTGVNWVGFEGKAFVVQGLWTLNYQSILSRMRSVGFNTIRMPFTNQILQGQWNVSGVNYVLNPDFVGLSPLECLDKIVTYCGQIGLSVILTRSSAKVDLNLTEILWYIPGDRYYTDARFVSDWVMVAKRYVNTAVVAVDLWDAPKRNATWGTGSLSTDWNAAAERAGNAILKVNPNLLIIVAGIVWAGDLTGVQANPIQLSSRNKLVYSVHMNPDSCKNGTVTANSAYLEKLRARWNENFGFITIQQNAPVIVSSFATVTNFAWLSSFLDYTNGEYVTAGKSELPVGQVGMSWSFDSIGPYGDCGGLYKNDWKTLENKKIGFLKPYFAPLIRMVGLKPVNRSYIVPQPSWQPTAKPSQPLFSYFHTSGNQIVDRNGNPIRLSGMNWEGFEGKCFRPQGLWARNYKSMANQIKSLGFNSFRIPFSNQMLRNTSLVTGIDYYLNPDLEGLTPLQLLDVIIEYCGSINMRIILDRHSAKQGNYIQETLWYIPGDSYYTEAQMISDWVFLAQRYKGTAVIGADLWNEPKMESSWGTGDLRTDWNSAAERIGNAILAVNPDWLIFVEGIGVGTWWGGNLLGVASNPVVLSVPNKLVYSVHEYCQDVHNQTWFLDPIFPNNLRTVWERYFGYIVRQQIAPLWVGEFGTAFRYPYSRIWLSHWIKYMNGEYSTDGVSELPSNHLGISWCFWSVTPGGDVGGIFKDDWLTIEADKMLFMSEAMGDPLYTIDRNVAFISPPLNKTSVVPMPTAAPTSRPRFLNTSGNQIVTDTGHYARLTGVNWYGFESAAHIPQGLWIRTYKSILTQVRDLGFNTVRLTFSNEMLRNDSKVSGIDYYLNPELQGLSPLECLDSIIGYAGLLGLRIVLSRMAATANVEMDDFWYIPNDEVYTPDLFKSDWVMLAQRYAGTAVVAADLWNDPSTRVTWGDGNEEEDWKLAAERVGNAILSVNPDWLIMVAGMTFNSWAGSNLAVVGVNPIILSSPNKLVYSIHEYTADTLLQPWFADAYFPATLRPVWDSNFGFLLRNNIAPVIASGFGASFADRRDYTWFPLWMNYTQGQYSDDNVNDLYPGQFGMSWMYWALNPQGSIGGILHDNWQTVDSRKMKYLSPHLAPMFNEFATSPTSAPYFTKYPSVKPVAISSASPTLPVISYYHTNGSQIVDQSGNPVRFFGVNWYGFEGTDCIPQGLWKRSYRSILDQIKALGFNVIRLPYSTQMLQVSSASEGIDYYSNPDLRGLSPLQNMDKIIQYCGEIGLGVILDRHSSRKDNFVNEGLWYFPTDPFNYGEKKMTDDWVMLAIRYKDTAVLGADLWNEPKGQSTWASGDNTTDWNKAAERIGNAILAANSDWLIIVEGVGNNSWWGGNLEGVADNPVVLNVPNKIVYSVHEYCQDVSNQTWLLDPTFPNNLRSVWDKNFGYIVKQNIAPVYVGEYGTAFRHRLESTWLKHWIKYMNGEFTSDGVNDLLPNQFGLSWTFWAFNPGGDVGGLLEEDWITVNELKMSYIRPAMEPLVRK